MATTSYSTDGAAVPAATTNPTSPADFVERSATGAGAAQSAQERTYDAQRRADVPGAVGGPGLPRWHCGWICATAVAVIVVVLLTSAGSSGGGA